MDYKQLMMNAWQKAQKKHWFHNVTQCGRLMVRTGRKLLSSREATLVVAGLVSVTVLLVYLDADPHLEHQPHHKTRNLAIPPFIGEETSKMTSSFQGTRPQPENKESMEKLLKEDMRDRRCLKVKYPDDLPRATIVIELQQNTDNILQMTLESILKNTDSHLLQEVIIMDGGEGQLDNNMRVKIKRMRRVRLISYEPRGGVVAARMLASSVAQGEVLVFLDATSLCTPGWLEPLLLQLWESRLVLATPSIEPIKDGRLLAGDVRDASKRMFMKGFDWKLVDFIHSVHVSELAARRRVTDTVRVPLVVEGLFAIDKSYLRHLGGFDEQIKTKTGANFEISFKVWQCGGRVEVAPCSRVVHLIPSSVSPDDNTLPDLQRVAVTWMDDYAQIFFKAAFGKNKPPHLPNMAVQERVKKEHGCRTFHWFLSTVYTQLFTPGDTTASGKIASRAQFLCLEAATSEGQNVVVSRCKDTNPNQFWELSTFGEIRRGQSCFDFSNSGLHVVMYTCHRMKGNQQWSYLQDDTVQHVVTGLCLELAKMGKLVEMRQCRPRSDRQRWTWTRKTPVSANMKH